MNETITRTKICIKCQVEKELSCFYKAKLTKDGLTNECKICISERKKAHYEANREIILEQQKTYYRVSREIILEQQRTHYEANRERISGRHKTYREANGEKIKAYQLANRESRNEQQKIYRLANREKISEQGKAYYKANREALSDKNRKYNKTPNGRAADKNGKHKRRVITKQGDVTTKQLLQLQQNSKMCYWCGISLKKVKVHIDHYVPLSKGGLHTVSNLVVSCCSCNQSKKDKNPLEFAQSLGRLL